MAHDGGLTLERSLGCTTFSNASLSATSRHGLTAHAAGCLAVLSAPLRNRQTAHLACPGAVTALAFSREGSLLAAAYRSAGGAGAAAGVRIWGLDAATCGGALLLDLALAAGASAVACLAFSPDARFLAVAGARGVDDRAGDIEGRRPRHSQQCRRNQAACGGFGHGHGFAAGFQLRANPGGSGKQRVHAHGFCQSVKPKCHCPAASAA